MSKNGHSGLDDFANSLDPLHLDDAFCGNGDGYTDFTEFATANDDDDLYGNGCSSYDDSGSDEYDDEESFSSHDSGLNATKSVGNNQPIITLQFEVAKPKRTAPTDGMWKYFDGDSWWDFIQALIDHFPELGSDYDGKSDFRGIITETYEIDKPRAVAYLLWLWESFPKEFFKDEVDGFACRNSYRCRGYLLLPLIQNFGKDPYLQEQMKTEAFLKAAFYDGVMTKHEIDLPEAYISKLCLSKDFDGAMKAYNAFLEGQKGRYGEVDIGKLWLSVVYSVKWCEDLSDKETFDMLTKIRSIVDGIGIRGTKVLKEIDEALKRLQEDIAYEEEDEDSDSDDDDVYAGTNERRIEHEEAKEKERAHLTAQKADQKTVYEFCQIIFDYPNSPNYYYFTNGLSVEIGDRVVVPFGYQNEEREAIVVSKGACTAAALPCSIDWIKKVIRKI